ncbi:hypothetical protein pdam_00025531 [Pocillopora damicornis]|uniref:Uncharacterized protein n=1 Tax=Pocillopora damicornis TaxID=46731 RepID=A0A3M6TYX6_POCDA|nr:hypothetical protein pdam_00025531 [Pocillopora damicornis]
MSFREYYLLSGPDRPSDRQECEIETLWNARESYGLCPWHCPDAHTVLVQLNTLSFPKSVITYTPQINMEIPPKLTKEDKQVRDYIKESGCKNIDKFLNPILKWHRQVARSRSEHCSNREKVAEVGNTETTSVPTYYNHPSNPKIKLRDVPGVRTKTQGAATYWENKKLDKCDGYLIFASGRFTENDELPKIRKDCLENLMGVESKLVDVYLISNRSPDKWDFR